MIHAELLQCPNCKVSIDQKAENLLSCLECPTEIPVKGSCAYFVPNTFNHDEESKFSEDLMFNKGITVRLSNFGQSIPSSEFVPIDHIQKFVEQETKSGTVVELGSGNRKLHPDVITVDLFPFPNVTYTMDIHCTAFRDESVDAVILDCVLEHVADPQKVIHEVCRILKPGGKVVCVAPWIFPYHGYPKNYFNISKDGLDVLFQNFAKTDKAMHHGPSVALTNLVSEYVAVALSGSNKFGCSLLKGLCLLPIFWLKYLDVFWSRSSKSLRLASIIAITAVK